MINKYEFNLITVNDKDFKYDCIIDWNGEIDDWFRDEHHIVELKDITVAVKKKPTILVIGTGENGMVEVKEEVKNYCKQTNIKLIIEKTPKAVEEFNNRLKRSNLAEWEQERIVGLFHLTC